jgi:hypothetical protein
MVYALNQYGDLVCLKTADGKEVWRKNLYTDFGGKIGSNWDYSESPLVDGGNVVCTPGGAQGSVVALNKKTGEPVWRAKEVTDDADYSSLVPVEFGGVRQYIQLSPKSVYAVAADSASRSERTACERRIYKRIPGVGHRQRGLGFFIGCRRMQIKQRRLGRRDFPICRRFSQR